MDSEIIFNRRMKRKDKLIARTAQRYINLYAVDDKVRELYCLHTNKVDIGYVDEFLKDLKEEIIQQLS